ncbi:MAG TPA: DUF5672 family protein [Casimicrobiaceae bacterium]|nr:DUF5672 family protein [Casimicrobiaceae bacterium]
MVELADVTLAAVDTANQALALRALDRSRRELKFARVVLLTDNVPTGVLVPDGIDVAPIARLPTRTAYSEFVLKRLLPHVATSHVLLIQWDGYVANPDAWDPAFLACDYIGARWFWQPEGFRVGNGGFSLRSRKLLDALQDDRIVLKDVEDLTIGHAYRTLLETEHGIRFASEQLADRFSFEAAYPIGKPFGFHGLFNFARIVDDAELATLAAMFGDAIARSPQMGQLVRNTIAMGRLRAAVALAERRSAALPSDADAAALLAQARRGAAQPIIAGRNDPCPCGSGRRYKHCHGSVATASANSPSAPTREQPPERTAVAQADALAERALDAHRRGDIDAAMQGYRAALAASPVQPHAMHYLGVIAYQRGDFAGALPLIERSAALLPAEPEFHNNAGLVLAAMGRHDDATAAYRRTLALAPQHATAWSNVGLSLTATNALPAAIDAFSRAITIAPDHGEAHWNFALALLRSGDFTRGLREYEWRLRLPAFRGAAPPPTPRWTGDDVAGKTLLVIAEQGLGDTLHFLRFARDLTARGARVVVEVPRALAKLATTVPGVAAVTARDEPRPPHDAWIPLMSVPLAIGLTKLPDTAVVPYLAIDPARRTEVAAELGRVTPRRPRVGIAWAGAPDNTQDRLRSCPLAALATLLQRDDVTWVSLQKGDGEEEIATVPAAERLALIDARNDFDSTAALVAGLDLVITVDTSIAHLAGALARPVWILLPYAADWRWQQTRSDTPWYPTARLFRQPRSADWGSVVRDVAAALDLQRW